MIVAALLAIGLLQDAVTLSIAYSDGRTTRRVIARTTTNAWTPYFPKSAEWRSPDGLPVSGIKYSHVLEDGGVRVRISLYLGPALQREVDVATVMVTRDTPVRVAALESYGVEPIVLSLSEFEPRALAPPQVENKTASIQIESVEMSGGTRPGYQVSVRNHASKPVMAFHVDSVRDGKPALITWRGERDGRPVVAVGATYTFFLPTEHPLDLVRITGLVFEDGSIEGDAKGVATTRVVYLGRRLMLGQVVGIFQEAARGDLAQPASVVAALTSRVEALPVRPELPHRAQAAGLVPPDGPFTSSADIDGALAVAMADTRRGVLSDLAEAPRDREAFATWLREINAQYMKWYLRFIDLTAR